MMFEDEEEFERQEWYLNWLRTQTAIRDCEGYSRDKNRYIEAVEEHGLQFYHRLKYYSAPRI